MLHNVYRQQSLVTCPLQNFALKALEQRWVAQMAPFDYEIKYRYQLRAAAGKRKEAHDRQVKDLPPTSQQGRVHYRSSD